MSVREIDFTTTDDFEIKIKNDPKSEVLNEQRNAGIEALNVRANSAKCGEVLLGGKEEFVLICGFCDNVYMNMPDFGKHIKTKHLHVDIVNDDYDRMNAKDETSVNIPKLEIDFIAKPDEIKVVDIFQQALDDDNRSFEDVECANKRDEEYYPEEAEDSDDNSEDCNDSDFDQDTNNRKTSQLQPDANFFCEKCNRQYKSNITFKRHIKNMHSESRIRRKLSNLKCHYCDEEFQTEEELMKHKYTHDRVRPFKCPQCPKAFTSSNHRQKHINMHMGYRPYKCSECSSSFGTECNLRQHMLTHAVAGPLSCEFCGKQFIHQSRKDVHMRSHTGEKPFQCELCGRKFIIRSRLTEHMKRHNNTRNHECEICGKKFYTNVMLKHHQVAHSNDRPFACSDCGKTFPRKLSLKMHRKIHSETKQYSCNICGKAFKQYAGLYAHRKSHGEKKGLPQTNIAVSDKYTPPTHLLIVSSENEIIEGES